MNTVGTKEHLDVSKIKYKRFEMPILNGLDSISLESTMLKIFEEGGELSRVIGRHRGMNGEKVRLSREEFEDNLGEELLDLIQSVVTVTTIIENTYNINLDHYLDKHIRKLKKKGYLMDENSLKWEE